MKKLLTPRQKSRNQRAVQNLSPTARFQRQGLFIPVKPDASTYDAQTEEEKQLEKKRNHELKMIADQKRAKARTQRRKV